MQGDTYYLFVACEGLLHGLESSDCPSDLLRHCSSQAVSLGRIAHTPSPYHAPLAPPHPATPHCRRSTHEPLTPPLAAADKQEASPICTHPPFLSDTFRCPPPIPSLQLLISKKSRRSREQAFVEFDSISSAQAAITAMDGIDSPALVKQTGCGGLVVRFADRKKEDEM